jgi:hypothetical protein
MSNALAIAAVTSAVRFVLDLALQAPQPGQVGGATVTTLRPDRLADADAVGAAATGINVYLYQVTPNHAWNLTDLPTRRQDGSLVRRPIAALDLHYLLTTYGDDVALDNQRLLGRAMLALAVTPVLTRDLVTAAMLEYGEDTATAFLAAADLADQLELVKLSPEPLNLEELSKLWGTFGTPYLLSLAYTATVVLLEADVTPRTALPVRQRVVAVTPAGAPRIARVDPDPPGSVVTAGSPLDVAGSGLLGPVTRVRLGPVDLDPGTSASPQLLRVTVTDDVPAGVHSLQVIHRSPAGPAGSPPERVVAASNAVPVLVRPGVTVSGPAGGAVTLDVHPPLRAGQRGVVSLGRLSGGADGDPAALSFAVPPLPPGAPAQQTITLDVDAIGAGTWLVRIDVAGVESLPELVDGTYGAPAVTVP